MDVPLPRSPKLLVPSHLQGPGQRASRNLPVSASAAAAAAAAKQRRSRSSATAPSRTAGLQSAAPTARAGLIEPLRTLEFAPQRYAVLNGCMIQGKHDTYTCYTRVSRPPGSSSSVVCRLYHGVM